MKLEMTEVYFIKQAISQVNIKATDAPVVAKTMDKVERELQRLQKLEEKKQAASTETETVK
jgi:hypothetical protein